MKFKILNRCCIVYIKFMYWVYLDYLLFVLKKFEILYLFSCLIVYLYLVGGYGLLEIF